VREDLIRSLQLCDAGGVFAVGDELHPRLKVGARFGSGIGADVARIARHQHAAQAEYDEMKKTATPGHDAGE
jgi:hypothetical protein